MSRFAGTNQRASERGTVLLMATITILVVVGMLALAVDVGYLMNGRGQLQNVVDLAALAGAHGLRVAIEPAGSKTQQDAIIRKLARDFAAYNPVRRADGAQALTLPDSDIIIEYSANAAQPARVIVKNRTALPTIFGNIFGISSMNVSAVAITSTAVVDGGTGVVSGCWRPLLIPDTFYDKDRNAWAISGPANFSDGSASPSRPGTPEAKVDGDYYISRFASAKAGSDRNHNKHFLQQWPTNSGIVPTGEATSIRDAYDLGELKYVNGAVTGRNLIGQRIKLRRDDWRIVNFANSGITGSFPTDPVQQINKGCCTPIRVGQLVQVYTPTDENVGIYESFIQELKTYRDLLATSDLQSLNAQQYRYVQSQRYPTPNANPRIIPVLLCSPIEFSNSSAIPQFYVTDIGAFFLEVVNTDGSITGTFVREVMTGGTPLQAQDGVANSGLLPISVHLVR